MGSRSQVDWRWTCRHQRLVRSHKGHRKDKAREYLFRSIQFKCSWGEIDVFHGASLVNRVALCYGV
jgi:hypothetical protein